MNKGLIVIISIVLVFLSANYVSAQVRTITISPPAIEISLEPGGYAEGTVKLINDGTETLYFESGLKDFIVEDPRGIPTFIDNDFSQKYSASSWIETDPPFFTINPGNDQLISYYINVPRDARPGGHYAAIIFSPQNSSSLNTSGASVNTSIAALLSITVSGKIKEQARVIDVSGQRFNESGPVKITTAIENLGDTHIRPKGTITLTNMLGQATHSLKLPEQNIFPEATRTFEADLGQKLMLGRYKASFTGSYGANNNNPLFGELYFWVFPWRTFILVMLAAVAGLLWGAYLKKRRKPKKPDVPIAPIQ